MKRFMQSKTVKALCYFIAFAMFTGIMPVRNAGTPAAAQVATTYSVGVVDLVNESGVGGDSLARTATDSVVVEMSKSSRYDVTGITRSHMKAEMDKLGVKAPLTKTEVVRVGEALGADAMLVGSLNSVKITGEGDAKRATVKLVLQLIDQASGELINGAVQEGFSDSKVGYVGDDDALINEAINNAAYLAAKTIEQYTIPEATVMMHVGDGQVMINKGSREGMKKGMRMVVLRQSEVIGYIQLNDVSPNDSVGLITDSRKGINSEDKVRAVFDMPVVKSAIVKDKVPNSAPDKRGGPKISKKSTNMILGVAALLGLAACFSGGRGSSGGSAIASAGDQGIIKWDTSKFNKGANVVEYQIMRDNETVPFAVLDTSTSVDMGMYDIAGEYGPSTRTKSVTYKTVAGNKASSYSTATGSVTIEPYGKQHTYYIRALLSATTTTTKSDDDDDSSTVVTSTEYYFSGASGQVKITAIEPIDTGDLISPANGSEVIYTTSDTSVFCWPVRDGANVYQVQFFLNGSSVPFKTVDNIYLSGSTNMMFNTAQLVDVMNTLKNYAEQSLAVKVNCRNTADTSAAFCEGGLNFFTIADVPPAPPM
ncbi:MAG: hypothetical protein J6332_09150 [Abditibacteriota bacterium]|nr:hypothetical protein [Abditibacteriota bacterium]